MANIWPELKVISMPPGYRPPGVFDCGERDLNGYLADGDADRDQQASVSQTYLVIHDEQMIGYFAVLSDAIRLTGDERPPGIPYGSAPAVKLGRVAVCREYRGPKHCVGEWILKYVTGMARELSKTIGVRYITLDAMQRDKLIKWYERNGFVRNEAERETRKFLRFWRRKTPLSQELSQVSMRFDILLQAEAIEEQ